MEKCKLSIQAFGQYTPIVVSQNEILCGTLVYDALKKLKIKKTMIVQLGKIDEQKKKEIRYIDNRTFEMSFWKEELKPFLMNLEKEKAEICGFSENEIENLINDFSQEINVKSIKENITKNDKKEETWYCPNCGWKGCIK